jgi:threonine aldolase
LPPAVLVSDVIDLRSDTVTRPSEAMRRAAGDATVGDDVYGEDPTVNELEARAAEAVGTEAALFVPTGTMGNQAAVRVHTDRGQEILLERSCHIYKWELGGVAQHSSVQARPVDGDERGALRPADVRDGFVEESLHEAGTGLVTLENTHNSRGGRPVPPEAIDAAAAAAHDRGVPVHLDGARLFNAAVALDVPVTRITRSVDTVMFCLSKGLGAPVGSVLAGSEAFVERARRIRKLLGGGMRQAGIVAAPGLLALESHDHLADDHEHARRLAEGLADVEGLSVQEPETNIVLVETDRPAEAFLDACESEGVLGVPFDDHCVRFCTHWDVDSADVERAIEGVRDAVRAG